MHCITWKESKIFVSLYILNFFVDNKRRAKTYQHHQHHHWFYSSYCKYLYGRDVYYNDIRQKTALEKQVKYFSFLFIFYVIKNFSEEMARGTSELIRRFCLFSFKRRSSSPSSTSTSDNSESEEERKVGTWPDWLVRIKLWQVTTWPWNSVIRLQSTLALRTPRYNGPPDNTDSR